HQEPLEGVARDVACASAGEAGFEHRFFNADVESLSCSGDTRICGGFPRDADRFEPTAHIDLRVSFAAEMQSVWLGCDSRVPFEHRELLIRALNHEPVIKILRFDST